MAGIYPDEVIEEIRNANDIVQVVSEYVKLQKKGRNYFGVCPFHNEKTPSFSVEQSKQIYYCFGCGKGGNVLHFVMEIEHLGFTDALKRLADRANILLPEGSDEKDIQKEKQKKELVKLNTETARFFHKNLTEGENAGMEFFLKRGLTQELIRRFGLGYATEDWDKLDKHLMSLGFTRELILMSGLVKQNKNGGYYDIFRNRVMFPIFDVKGDVIAFGGRVLDDSIPKYLNSPENIVFSKSRNLYGLNIAKKSGKSQLVIVEGYMDVISLHQFGINNAVASLGTSLTELQARLLKRYSEEVIIAYDADTAGQSATLRGMEILNNMKCQVRILRVPSSKDPDEFIRERGRQEFVNLIKSAKKLTDYKLSLLYKDADLDSTDGKIDFLNKAADVLAKVDNLVEREMYIKKICKEQFLNNEALRGEIEKRIRADGKQTKNYKTVATVTTVNRNELAHGKGDRAQMSGLIKAERMLIATICIEDELFGKVKDRIDVEDFSDYAAKEAAQYVFQKITNGNECAPADLLSGLEEDSRIAFAKIFETDCDFENVGKAFNDCLCVIERNMCDIREREIIEMLEGRKPADKDKNILKEEYLSLIKKNKKGGN
jgi:DNA primase